jgi:hypothetical protein
MSDNYPDGTIIVTNEDASPYNVYVRASDSGWEDRFWWAAGSDIPESLPAEPFRVLLQPEPADE